METGPHFHNITAILSPYPELSVFSHYLTLTGVAAAVNVCNGKTVCAVDNAAMEDLLAHNPSLSALQNILSFHVFHDCYTAADLRRCEEAITCFGGGDAAIITARSPYERVEFHATATGKIRLTVPFASSGFAEFQRQIKFVEETYLSVIQISNLLPTLDILSPMEADDPIRTIYSHGCRSFAAAIASFPPVVEALRHGLRSCQGLTVFCPIDQDFWSSEYFRTDLGMLTQEDQMSVLLYHAMPSYHSMEMLRSATKLETLAVGRSGRRMSFGVKTLDINGEKAVVVETPAVYDEPEEEYLEKRITLTLVDEKPLALYAINGVLPPLLY